MNPDKSDAAPRLAPLITAALDAIKLAVTLIDTDGTILYFNPKAAEMLDRRPEYLGRDVRLCHKPESAAKIDRLLAEFAEGRREPLVYRASRDGKQFEVTASPLVVEGCWVACLHQVALLKSE